jgi:hypothetical protein
MAGYAFGYNPPYGLRAEIIGFNDVEGACILGFAPDAAGKVFIGPNINHVCFSPGDIAVVANHH